MMDCNARWCQNPLISVFPTIWRSLMSHSCAIPWNLTAACMLLPYCHVWMHNEPKFDFKFAACPRRIAVSLPHNDPFFNHNRRHDGWFMTADSCEQNTCAKWRKPVCTRFYSVLVSTKLQRWSCARQMFAFVLTLISSQNLWAIMTRGYKLQPQLWKLSSAIVQERIYLIHLEVT